MRALLLSGAAALAFVSPAAAADEQGVLDTYMAIAEAGYADSLDRARTMAAAIDRLIAEPSEGTLDEARDAWISARVPYQQTEVYRFGNAIVDEWEGRVNAWPLDEGLIDYVAYGGATDENLYAGLNIIASPTLSISGREIDASTITPALIRDLHEFDAIEANVTTGYHAIEFLLWGQDLGGTGAGKGTRPATDFDPANCTGGNCERRAQYLQAAVDLLLSDLQEMVEAWAPDGAARQELRAKGVNDGIGSILTGMGSLSYGEQAGERMKLGLLLNDPEEEHDCFSDNTHNSHFYDGLGVRNVYLGRYVRVDGSVVEGPSVSDLVAAADPEIDVRLRRSLDDTMMALTAIKVVAEAGTSYDRLLAPGNAAGEALIQAAIDALVAQTREIERAVAALDMQPIAFESSDSLDDPAAVFQ